MEMDLPENPDFEAIDISLVDLSSQNDFQFSEHDSRNLPGDASAEERPGTYCAIEQFPILHETMEPEIIPRKGKYNLRKSLAWDSAFFTSAGVLDPEELSTMLKGPEKRENQLLTRIEEDISGSNESISSFETDLLTVDSLENELFGDIRASIQRSNKKTSNSTNSSMKIETMETDSTAISSLQKDNLASETKNPEPTSKKNSGLQTTRLSKSQPKQNMLKLGSAKAVKQDGGHSQVAQSTAKNGESNSLPKPPKAVSRSILDSTEAIKQDTLGRNRAKSECGSSKLVSEKAAHPPKPSILNGSQRPLPKPALISKSSSLRSSITSRVQSTRSHTSSNSYHSMSSNAPAKSSLAAVRRNPVKSSSSFSASSSPIPKVPSRGTLRNKPSPSTLSAYVKPTKISSGVSPASSISEWSSVSSSCSVINQRSSNSRTSLEMDSCRSLSSDTILRDPRNHSANQLADGQGNHELGQPVNSSTKSSARVSALQAPVKPSGLRMPSPKIGYFDGVKSSVCTPKRTLQSPSSLHTVIPKSGSAACSPNRGSNIKLKSYKTSTARTVSAGANIKPNSPKAVITTSFHTCVLTDEKDSPIWSIKGKDYKTGESCSEAQKQAVDAGAGSGAVVNGNLAGLNNETGFNANKNMEFEGVKIPLVEGINPSGCIGWRVGEGVRVEQNHPENKPHQTCNIGDKENHHAKDPGEMLKGLTLDVNPYIPSSMAEILKEISDYASISPKTATESCSSQIPICSQEWFL
ncbi:uncharacterized protein LOC142540192 isoform X1 [Primulina tabacum]|uniref:uncharacterized protein LOC142540192 isoform X1 n=1 Tax=Primulina tabacum TaxID=48773 RepID=UPI003F5A25E5